jgi:hypothetical protein
MSSCTDYLLSTISSQEQLTDVEITNLRDEYLSVVKRPDQLHQWVQNRATSVQNFETALLPFSVPVFPHTYTPDGKRKHTPINTVLSIGRGAWCDVYINQPGISRLHALLFKVHNAFQKPVFAVLDLWSLNGTSTSTQNSTSTRRNILYQDADIPFILSLGGDVVHLSLNLQECLVCLDNPRDTLFESCGHLVTCQTCSTQLCRCPICQVPIRRSRLHADYENKTYEPQ